LTLLLRLKADNVQHNHAAMTSINAETQHQLYSMKSIRSCILCGSRFNILMLILCGLVSRSTHISRSRD